MATYTTHFGFYKPDEADGDENGHRWAAGWNGNLDEIDARLFALAPARVTSSVTTAVLASGAAAQVELDLAPTTVLQAISTDHPAEVRVYGTAAARTADASRLPTVPPVAGNGLMFQATTTAGLLTIRTSPVPIFSNGDTVPAPLAYLRVVNKDTVARAITVTLSHLPQE